MKKFYFIILFCSMSILCFSQSNDVTVFSEKGEKFILYVNGIQYNENHQSNVKAKDLSGDSFSLRVIFEDRSIPELTSNKYTEATNVEMVFVVKRNNKGKYALRWVEEVPRKKEEQARKTENEPTYEDPRTSTNLNLHTTEVTTENTTSSQSEVISMNTGINTGEESFGFNMQVSESGVNISGGSGEESFSMNINLGNISSDNINTTNTSSSTTITTTTTTTTTTNNYDTPSTYIPSETITVEEDCSPMTNSEFTEAVQSIQSKSFNDSQLTLAKQICKSSCLTSEQIRDINKIFSYENTRLEFSKFAYDYVYDPSKYYKVNDSFSFESSIDELSKYIESK